MLKRFSVTNFSSFKDEQVFDMTAGTTKVLADHAIDFGDVKILKSAVIYGANASGKSNLVKAIDFSKNVVLKDLNNIETYKKHFRLCNESYKKDSSFEFEIEIGGRFFSYGFSILLKEKTIKEEWLVEIGKGNPNIIFQRTGSEIVLGSKISLDKNSKTRLEIYSDDMKNQEGRLFLTEVAGKKLDLEIISPINDIFNWFKSKLIIVYPDSKFGGVQLINKDFAEQLSHYLKSFDTGVVSVNSIEEDFEEAFKGLPEELKIGVEEGVSKAKSGKVMVQGIGAEPQFLTVYKNKNDELKVKKLGLVHGKEIKETFELYEESDGTLRLLDFIPLIDRFSSDCTIVIDEFDRSLHPKLTREFMSLFHKLSTGTSQLLVTTHESTLLDLNLIRRDEIWFVDKGDDDSSKIFSLNKFQVRYDTKIEKAYLLGRYGAVPIFNTFNNI